VERRATLSNMKALHLLILVSTLAVVQLESYDMSKVRKIWWNP
jgi:hypothetical protein